MSDLQCAATLLLTTPFTSGARPQAQAEELAARLAGRRVAGIHSTGDAPAVAVAELVADRLRLRVDVREELEAWSADELASIVDLHRGETVLVVGAGVRGVVRSLATDLPVGFGTTDEAVPLALVEVDADADGWVIRSWDGGGPSAGRK